MRGWRPSRFATARELLDDSEGTKEANMFRYEQRAEKGVPLFDPDIVERPQSQEAAESH